MSDILSQMEAELIAVKSVRILCNYPWAPGKRLRPITFLLSNLSIRVEQSVDVSANHRESRLAAAIELLHEASLVHDDLVDRSEVRRGAPTVQMENGKGMALLIGDYMVFRGLKLILDSAKTQNDIVLAQELTDVGLSIAHGEIDQLDQFLRRRPWNERMSMDNYLSVIAKKTAVFFAGCAEAGAALAHANASTRKLYREFGMNMGMVFQMVDDLMDVLGDAKVACKSLRNNLEEGTVTLPMIHAWQLYPENRSLHDLASGESLDGARQDALYRKLADEQVLSRCRETMSKYTRQAEACLRQMPNNIFRAGLNDLLIYITACPWGGVGTQTKSERDC